MTELSDMFVVDTDSGQVITPGEAAIMAKLEALSEQLDELTEKVNNLNLFDNDGFSIDT